MNASICSAEAMTHIKIVVIAMAVAIAVVWIVIAARTSSDAITIRTAEPTNSAASLVGTMSSNYLRSCCNGT
jgi:hypothetical protein